MRRHHQGKQTNWKKRIVELSLEVAAAVALVLGILAYALYGPKKSLIDGKWVAFGLNTAFVFGTVLKLARPLWNKAKVWLTLGFLLLVHIAVGWMVLRDVEKVGLVWYVPIVLAEINVIVQLIERVFTSDELQAAAPATHHSQS